MKRRRTHLLADTTSLELLPQPRTGLERPQRPEVLATQPRRSNHPAIEHDSDDGHLSASTCGACGEPGTYAQPSPPHIGRRTRPMVRSPRRSSPTSSCGPWRVDGLDGLVDGRRLGLSPIFTNGFSFTVGEPSRSSSPARRGLVPGEPVPAGLQTGDLGRRHRFDPTDKRGTSDTVPPCINRLPVGRRRVGRSDGRSRHDRPRRPGQSMSSSSIS